MYKKIKEENIYNGRILNLNKEVFFYEGKEITREIVRHKDAVAVLPIDEYGYVYLVKQYRFPMQQEVLEIPAGLVEENEDYEEAVLREMQEEIGYSCNNLEKIFEGYNSIGFCDEKTIIYRGTELFPSKLQEDDDENISIVKIHIDELKQMYINGEIIDFKTAVAILNEFKRSN